MSKTIIIFGYGYVSKFLIQKLNALVWIIYCTSMKVDIGRPVKNENATIINFLDPALPSLISNFINQIIQCALKHHPAK